MAAEASSLHCPNCGAPAEADARRCGYCRARLATVSCGSCFELMFDGTAFCPRCGGARARSEQHAPAATCPGCRQSMQAVEVGATMMLECEGCDGIWVDAQVFESLCADHEAQSLVLHRFDRARPHSVERVRYRPCPRCQKMMNRVNFGRLSGTVVDVCRGHGTFLDPGELHQIVQFIKSGGLERARRRAVEELKEQERRLRDLEARAARERGKADPRGGTSRWRAWSLLVGDDT